MSRLPKLGILGSGSGSNCQSIYDAIQSGSLRAEIAVVMSDNPDAYILERARSWGIPAEVIDCGGFKTRFPEESQASVAARLKQYGVDCVCLAGFMRLVKLPLLKEFPSRILNIHPALIPSFCGPGMYGLRPHEAALARGCKVTGATVHFVNEECDGGPILLQKAVDILPGDTPEVLQKRVMEQAEWKLLPKAVAMVCSGEIK